MCQNPYLYSVKIPNPHCCPLHLHRRGSDLLKRCWLKLTMSRSRSQPCSSCSRGTQNHIVSFPGGWSGAFGGTPIYHCREVVILRMARTVKNTGK